MKEHQTRGGNDRERKAKNIGFMTCEKREGICTGGEGSDERTDTWKKMGQQGWRGE